MLEWLPTIARKNNHEVFLVEEDIQRFLEQDLDVSRLNRIHEYLWMAGRPLDARTLVKQRMMGYAITVTEQADLHLLKYTDRILIKPLPEYLLHDDFWEEYLCANKVLHTSACGLLLSYMWLICSHHDLRIAKECRLVPSSISWSQWKVLIADFYRHIDVNALDQVNKRYHFGELRLSRINSIYRFRFFFTHYIRGYLYGYNRYVVFFQRNFAWILVVFVYFSVILEAMQVGLANPRLSNSHAFQRAAYGFTVFSTASAAFFLALPGVIFVAVFLFNMALAIMQARRQSSYRDKLARERRGRDKARNV